MELAREREIADYTARSLLDSIFAAVDADDDDAVAHYRSMLEDVIAEERRRVAG